MASNEHKRLEAEDVAEEFRVESRKVRAAGDILRARKLMAAHEALVAVSFLNIAIASAAYVEEILEPKCDDCGKPLDGGGHDGEMDPQPDTAH